MMVTTANKAAIGALASLTLVVSACGSRTPEGVRGLSIEVAPLDLAGIGDACFDLRVTNAAGGLGDVVWSRGTPGLNGGTADPGAVCSDLFGDGAGDVTYIGPCDASGSLDADPQSERINSVTLWFDGLYDEDDNYLAPDGSAGWQDPCPTGCTLDVLCEENADSLVAFDFTVMRDAQQGFFDVAVQFEDIFCSAKLDTCYDDDSQIRLLFGADGQRDWTAVFGFACTAGAKTQTRLHYGDLAVVCVSGATTTVFPLNPVGDVGNNEATVGGQTLHYGVYRGLESLPCDDAGTPETESCSKLYWNLAVSLDDLAPLGVCTLAFSATATDGGQGFANGLPQGAGVSWPYIDVAATLAPPVCQRHPLGSDAVKTAYHGSLVTAPVVMCSTFDGTSAGPVVGADCSDSCPNDPNKTRPGLCGCGVPDTDSDSDLSPDCSDACPVDPAKTEVGACGCGVAETDGDSDGTPDCNDECDVDPGKTAPGICGCGVADDDGDMDGTPDCNDECALDPDKTAPGVCGCGVADSDSDNDTVLDCNEICDNDPDKTEPGQCGCGVADSDIDTDGTADCNDECALDPTKTVPGFCGCGVADDDSDGDTVLDCNETCDEDPAKTAPGLCGCGVADTDSDGDTTPDCNETCDEDPAKTEPGVCGCGVADTDSDGDTTPDCNETCDEDPGKTEPGVCGCGVADSDSDGDTFLDCNETCDTDPGKTEPGVCGCGVADSDSDGDTFLDCNETCDTDPGKTSPGVCGCGVADSDSDGDTFLDCNETCDNDPGKTSPGVCGCGVADNDSDGDTVLDCLDGCPLDNLKTSPGTCGCGVPDSPSVRLGGIQANAASSCLAIVDIGHACGDGVYWVDTNGGSTSDATQVFCDMTSDGGGWMKIESATYPFWFDDSNWQSHNAANPLADNFSIVGQRQAYVDADGCYELRIEVGDSGNWLSALSHKTVWRQCHDPFTQTTNGSDYTFISGQQSTTCGGFNGLHHKFQGYSYTNDPDLGDNINCWFMQIVPKIQYNDPADWPGYLEGYDGANYHKWQSLWIRSAGLGKGREAPGATCEALRQAGVTDDGTYWLDPNGGGNGDAFLAYCDMTPTVGWTRIEGARHPFFFSSANWDNHQSSTPTADNFSMLFRRGLFASGGCTTWRMQLGDSGTWTSSPAHETAWTQCHDPFTQSSNGSGYTFVSGIAPITCGGFNGLHNWVQSFMYTSDADSTDLPGCWGMQMVPHTQYPSHPGYYDGYAGGAASHQWQTMWVK